jgi:predicted secreted protein
VNIVFACAMYFILWWMVFFAVLPTGVRTQAEAGEIVPGTEASAPVAPQIGKKVLITTLISAAIFGGLYALNSYGIIDLDNFLFGRP